MQELERRLEETIVYDRKVNIDYKKGDDAVAIFLPDVHIESVSEIDEIMNVELEAGHLELDFSKLNEKSNETSVSLESNNGEIIEFTFDSLKI